MELEFNREILQSYHIAVQTAVCQEETLESIVPDACPDILSILDVSGQAFLTGKQARKGLAEAEGTIRAVILYRPDSGTGLRKMEVTLPFRCQAEAPELTEHGIVCAAPRLRAAEARALNPRKVLIRVDLLVEITAYEPKEISVNTSATTRDPDSVCQKCSSETYYQRVSVQEKPFIFSDQIRLPFSQGENIGILTAQARAYCTESNLIGNKLIFKGNAELMFLTQDSSGSLTPCHETLPFSQIMEIPGVGEENDCRLQTEVTALHLAPLAGDEKECEVTLELLALAEVYCHRPITVLRDLYSTQQYMEVEYTNQTLCLFRDRFVRTQTVRELVETPGIVRSVLDSRLSSGGLSVRREGGEFVLTQEVFLTVLYLDEAEQIQCLRKSLPVVCRIAGEETLLCSCRCLITNDLYVSPAAGGVEVRFSAEFQCVYTTESSIPVVCGAKPGESRDGTENKRPSVILRLAMPDEELWNIAKSYGTTVRQIMQANGLESENRSESTMLLIPGRAK